jgi:hypothetical protein
MSFAWLWEKGALMEADKIFVLVVVVGVIAIIAWAERNSRRRQASNAQNAAEVTPSAAPDDLPGAVAGEKSGRGARHGRS